MFNACSTGCQIFSDSEIRFGLSATIHGEELNGLEIVRRVLEKLDARDFAGHLIAAPVVNVLGFMNQTRALPDGSDLNRAFPGSPEGSLAERLAHFFMEQVQRAEGR